MGTVYTEITLRNARDVGNAKDGIIKESEIRQTAVRALVDTGAGSLIINEEVFAQLGLGVIGTRRTSYANGAKEVCRLTEPVEIHWKDRCTAQSATVVLNCSGVLLGAIPLEDMDLIVDPARLALVGAHGDEVVTLVM